MLRIVGATLTAAAFVDVAQNGAKLLAELTDFIPQQPTTRHLAVVQLLVNQLLQSRTKAPRNFWIRPEQHQHREVMGAGCATRWPANCHTRLTTGARFWRAVGFADDFVDETKQRKGLECLYDVDAGTLVLFADIIVWFTLQQFANNTDYLQHLTITAFLLLLSSASKNYK